MKKNVGPPILLCEKNPSIRYLVYDFIDQLGHRVEVKNCGHSALQALQKQSYKFAVVNHNLDGLNGYEVVSQFRRAEGETPIILFAEIDIDALPADIHTHAIVVQHDPQRLYRVIQRLSDFYISQPDQSTVFPASNDSR